MFEPNGPAKFDSLKGAISEKRVVAFGVVQQCKFPEPVLKKTQNGVEIGILQIRFNDEGAKSNYRN